jgi:hypothetical protein
MAATVDQLLTGSYKKAAQQGLATSQGPNDQSFLLWILVQEINFATATDNVVREQYLLNHSPNIYR